MAKTDTPPGLGATSSKCLQEMPDSSGIQESQAHRQADGSDKCDEKMGNGQTCSQRRRRKRRGGRGRGRRRASAETASPQADSVQEDDEDDQAQPENAPSDDTSSVSGNASSSQTKRAEDQGPSLEGDLSRSPTKPEAATGEQGGHKNESWHQPEGEKDITKFRFP
ncbi:hypothetical protein CDV31_012866, partial [Fusarium ambrosium]